MPPPFGRTNSGAGSPRAAGDLDRRGVQLDGQELDAIGDSRARPRACWFHEQAAARDTDRAA